MHYYLLHFLTQGAILISEREVRDMDELRIFIEVTAEEFYDNFADDEVINFDDLEDKNF